MESMLQLHIFYVCALNYSTRLDGLLLIMLPTTTHSYFTWRNFLANVILNLIKSFGAFGLLQFRLFVSLFWLTVRVAAFLMLSI
jgi:hypothetical protein